MDWSTLSGIAGILLTNLVLSGDNALVIAMAARDLPAKQRRWAFLWGTVGAIVLRVVLTWPASLLLDVTGLRLVGGILLLWIAVKLLIQPPGESGKVGVGQSLWEAVRIIIVADVIMSLDNVLAIAAISRGNLGLLVFGLTLSMPILMGGAALVAYLLNRLSWLIWLGGALLTWVAGEMIVGDPLLGERIKTLWPALQQLVSFHVLIPLLITIVVVIAAYAWVQRRNDTHPETEP